jgi:hypothetical protein
MPSRLPVQVLGIPVRGDHIRSAGVSRCLGVSAGDGGMLPRQRAGIAIPAFLDAVAGTRRTTTGTGADPEVNRTIMAGAVSLEEQVAD